MWLVFPIGTSGRLRQQRGGVGGPDFCMSWMLDGYH